MSLAIYQNGACLYLVGDFTDGPPEANAPEGKGIRYSMVSNVIRDSADAGTYQIVLTSANGGPDETGKDSNRFDGDDSDERLFYVSILVGAVPLIILVTNRLLTRRVYKSIVTPLDLLVSGVHQIRDGNLNCRIAYTARDEFAGVCADFNEMAGRLLDMVNARQKDDENRRELIAGISHDLRTPLTSIKAYVEGLGEGVAATPESRARYINIIKSKTADLEHIIAQLFLFSKLDLGNFPFRMETFDIGLALSDFVKTAGEEYKQKGLSLDLAENTRGLMVNADSVQLGNVFANILENSVKYGSKNGGIMRIACRAENGEALITLTDNGPGVPEASLEKIFHVFYRSDKARSNTGQGSGLGLAISAKIMERLGGSIRAANAREGGLSVILRLPIQTGGESDEKNTDY
jgi:signal transduction histidine kinase